jgi:hypothetical protein
MKTTRKKNSTSKQRGYKRYAGILARHKDTLENRYKVKEIGIFGSFVRGEQSTRSDLDILVDFNEIPGLFEFIELEDYLCKVLRRKVDLVDKQGIRVQLRDQILGEVVYV